jgi:hypothetical protein
LVLDLDFSKQRLFFDFKRLRERNGFPTHKDGEIEISQQNIKEIEISQPKRKIHRVKLDKSQSKKSYPFI